MDRDLIERLMQTFLDELDEHVRDLNRNLLRMEEGPAEAEQADLVKSLFRTVHSLKGAARAVDTPLVESLCHEMEDILGAVRDTSGSLESGVVQLLLRAADALHDASTRLRAGEDLEPGSFAALMPELARVARAGDCPPAQADGAATLADPPETDRSPSAAPLLSAARDAASVRIPSEKLDALLARSGELLIARSRIEHRSKELEEIREQLAHWHVRSRQSPDALASEVPDAVNWLSTRLDRLIATSQRDGRALTRAARDLDAQVRHVRMLPFREACEGLQRSVRDVARSVGKEARIEVLGGNLEIDRSLLVALKDPLLHLVRNAIAHGLEAPEDRRAAGKPPCGVIRVAAALRGTHVEVIVADDGQGLDYEAIRTRARSRNIPLPPDEAGMAELLTIPGFSTAPIVSDLAGRGVGLDVVKDRIESLFGSFRIASSRGEGLTIVLALPLTLTSTRAVLVRSGGRTFALPVVSIVATLRVPATKLQMSSGREVLLHDGALLPVAALDRVLGLERDEASPSPGPIQLAVLSSGDQRVVLAVDQLLGDQEVVVKSLGSRIRHVNGISGATLLPDGRVTLILNPAELVRTALDGASGQPRCAGDGVSEESAIRRLLVVDDSVTTRSLEKSLLEAAGYDVIVAASGDEALRELRSGAVDLVVSDVEMPGMDGFQLTEAIRHSDRLRELPVILLTSLATDANRRRGMEAGANAYIVKGEFDQAHLLETVGRLL